MLLAGLVGTSALVLGACGSDATEPGASGQSGSESAEAQLQRAIETTSEVESGRFRVSVHVTGEDEGEDIDTEVEVEGSFTDEGGSLQVSTDLGRVLQDLAEPGEDVPSALGVELLKVGPDAWVKLASTPAEPGVPEGWIHLDETAGLPGGDFEAFDGALGPDVPVTNPDAYLDALRAEGVTVTQDGSDEIDGTEVMVLSGEIDPEAAMAGAPPEEAAEIEEALGESGVGPVPFKVYVDDDGLVRRLEVTVSGEPESGSVTAVIVIDLFDVGDDITVTPPPADEVVDPAQLGLLPFMLGGLSES